MFENNGHVHVYSLGAGAGNPWDPNILKTKSVNLVVCCKIFQINYFVAVFHI